MSENLYTVMREVSEKVARIDERTEHIQRDVQRLGKRIDATAEESEAAVAGAAERMNRIEQDIEVLKRLFRAVASMLATMLAAGVSVAVWLFKTGLR